MKESKKQYHLTYKSTKQSSDTSFSYSEALEADTIAWISIKHSINIENPDNEI
jgi:hypothetical protein